MRWLLQVALSALCAGCALASPIVVSSGVAPYNALGLPPGFAVPIALRSQYHAQDEFGQATYGHLEPYQTHNAVQDALGNKLGAYSYVAPTGELVHTAYVADGAGFRVASNALPAGPGQGAAPSPVEDTPEVKATRAAHLAEVAKARARTRRAALLQPPLGVAVAAAVVPVPVARPAVLSRVVNNPGHAVSYRVD